jgi:hypothetical protein
MDATEFRTVPFEMSYEARQVHLMLRAAEHSSASFIPMCHAGGTRWRASVRLRPGEYRFRFYVDDGHRLFYASPADFGTCEMIGLDGVMPVKRDSD